MDLLIEIKSPCRNSSLYFCRKALRNLDTKGDPELAHIAKLYGSDCAAQSIYDTMGVVGISSYSIRVSFAMLLDHTIRMPTFNVGTITAFDGRSRIRPFGKQLTASRRVLHSVHNHVKSTSIDSYSSRFHARSVMSLLRNASSQF